MVVAANDISHADVLRDLSGYEGFIICEKPLLIPGDDLENITQGLRRCNGFALDLVERYSPATNTLRKMVEDNDWRLLRTSFHWGKDRINDYRPTCGVTSEIIHALDLIDWICYGSATIELRDAIGVRSDFSISGDDVLDTVMLTAEISGAAVAGYASFTNIHRQRTVDFSFAAQDGALVHARLEFDEPSWDTDHLKVWSRDRSGAIQVLAEQHYESSSDLSDATIVKLTRLCRDVLLYVLRGTPPELPFAGLDTSVELQVLLNKIQAETSAGVPVRYVQTGTRPLTPEDVDLESLG